MESIMITLVPIGEVDNMLLESLGACLEEIFGQKTHIANKMQLPKESWHRDRRQYLASSIIAVLWPPSLSVDRVLGVVDIDLFAQGLNFVFGAGRCRQEECDYLTISLEARVLRIIS
jgi:archaemetzincin